MSGRAPLLGIRCRSQIGEFLDYMPEIRATSTTKEYGSLPSYIVLTIKIDKYTFLIRCVQQLQIDYACV